jgi:hypothetical protein
MGVTAETIADGEDGKVLWFGRIRGINTNAFNEGDILYASTTSAGAFQTTLPVAPNNIVEVCAVINKSSTNGVIFVRPQFVSITGSGTTNYVPRFTGALTIGNSQIIDNGTNVLINKTSDSGQKFQVDGNVLLSNTLTEIAGNNPTLRLKTSGNVFIINFRKDSNEDAATVKFDDAVDEFAITTNLSNYPIRIQPHGTGNIKIPNVPTGTGDVLMRDSSNNLVRGSSTLVQQTSGTFTPVLQDEVGGATYSYTVQHASYLKIGDLITFTLTLLAISSSGTPNGIYLRISGLPFTTQPAKPFAASILAFGQSSYTSTQVDSLIATIVDDSDFIAITRKSQTITPPTFISNGLIIISGTYFTT